jgi:hypothetical protein
MLEQELSHYKSLANVLQDQGRNNDHHSPAVSTSPRHDIDELWAIELGIARRAVIKLFDLIEGANPSVLPKAEKVGERASRLHDKNLISTSFFHQLNYILKTRNAFEYGSGHRKRPVKVDNAEAEEIERAIRGLADKISQLDEKIAAKLRSLRLPRG